MLTNAELDHYLNAKADNSGTKTDNDNLTSTDNSMPLPGTSTGSSVRRGAPISYAKSSVSEGGTIHGDTSDSEWSANDLPTNPKNAAQYHWSF